MEVFSSSVAERIHPVYLFILSLAHVCRHLMLYLWKEASGRDNCSSKEHSRNTGNEPRSCSADRFYHSNFSKADGRFGNKYYKCPNMSQITKKKSVECANWKDLAFTFSQNYSSQIPKKGRLTYLFFHFHHSNANAQSFSVLRSQFSVRGFCCAYKLCVEWWTFWQYCTFAQLRLNLRCLHIR